MFVTSVCEVWVFGLSLVGDVDGWMVEAGSKRNE